MSLSTYSTYAIVNGKDANFDAAQKSLATHIELQMIKGWQPQGGIIFLGLFKESDGVEKFVFSQAMLKPGNKE